MRLQLSREVVRSAQVEKVEELSGQNLLACNQCGACSAGCPAAFAMDVPPNQVIRLAQLGQVQEALSANTIWFCASCMTCMARCPKGVDLARVMEALRKLALEELGDHIAVSELPAEALAELPQQAFVGGFRKYTL